MSVMMRKRLSGSRLALRMGCGEQLLLSDNLSSGVVEHRDLARCDMKPRRKKLVHRGRGE